MLARSAFWILRALCGADWRGILPCCALLAAGCANWQLPRIDPSGDRLFLPPDAPSVPMGVPVATPGVPPAIAGQWGISVSPSQVIAPVGSEVVLIASVCGIEGYMLTDQRVEWMLAGDGVGQFVTPGQRRGFEPIHWLQGLPRKIDNNYAINTTLYDPWTLDRGTPTPTDDVLVQSGQAWLTVTSANEGTSRVTVYAPEVSGWDRRQQTATLYWVDAQWRFPPPAITPVGGRQTLTTTLARHSDNAPLVGWTVRYAITGGPDAGFAPDGAASVEIVTNQAGEAPAEVFQKQPAPGTNQISIQIIRPAGMGTVDRQLPVGAGSTLQTWASADAPIQAPAQTLAPMAAPPMQPTVPTQPPTAAAPSTPQLDVSITGPDTAAVGTDAQFTIVVTNRGSTPATRLMITDRFDPGLQHAASASPIQRDMVDLQPGEVDRLAVTFHVAQSGPSCQEVEVAGQGGLLARTRKCVNGITAAEEPAAEPPTAQPPADAAPANTPDATAPQLSLQVSTPPRQRVGDRMLLAVVLANSGQTSLENVVIANRFETSLYPDQATDGHVWLDGNSLGWKIGTLEAGKSVRRQIELKCLQETPRACDRVTVSATGIEPLTGRGVRGNRRCAAALSVKAAASRQTHSRYPSPTRPIQSRWVTTRPIKFS